MSVVLDGSRLKLRWPTRSGGLRRVVTYVMASPLCVLIVRRGWWVSMSKTVMTPAEVPTRRAEDVKEMAMQVIGPLSCMRSSF